MYCMSLAVRNCEMFSGIQPDQTAKYGSDIQTWALGLVNGESQVLKYELGKNLHREARPVGNK